MSTRSYNTRNLFKVFLYRTKFGRNLVCKTHLQAMAIMLCYSMKKDRVERRGAPSLNMSDILYIRFPSVNFGRRTGYESSYNDYTL